MRFRLSIDCSTKGERLCLSLAGPGTASRCNKWQELRWLFTCVVSRDVLPLQARRDAMDVTCSVEFKGFAYRTLASCRDPRKVTHGVCKGVRWKLEDEVPEDSKGKSGVKWKELPEGYEVRCCFKRLKSLLNYLLQLSLGACDSLIGTCAFRLRRITLTVFMFVRYSVGIAR
jgi:hypothetical protein